MSLKSFHIVFIVMSSLLSFVFGGWNFHFYKTGGASTHLALGIGSMLFGGLLVLYGFWFWRKIRSREEDEKRRRKILHTVPVLLALIFLGNRATYACSVCYGEAQGPMIDAARMGVWLLFGLVLVVQLAFALFFIHLWRRARKFRREQTAPQLAES